MKRTEKATSNLIHYYGFSGILHTIQQTINLSPYIEIYDIVVPIYYANQGVY